MSIPPALLSAFPPSADLLFDLARRRTDDAMLHEIAVADYGMGSDEALAALRLVRDRGVLPDPLPCILGDVLTLTHLRNLNSPQSLPFASGPTVRRAHQTRLFACAVLLRIEVDVSPEEGYIEWDSALAHCLASAKALGEEMGEAAARYLTWRIPLREPPGLDSILFALGLLVLATRLRRGRLTEPSLGGVAEWVLASESLGRRVSSVQAGFWQPLSAELLAEAESIRDGDVRAGLQLCALLLDQDYH